MRRVVVMCATAAVAGVFASVSGAAAPTVIPFSFSATVPVSGVCSFDLTLSATVSGTETVFTDSSGASRLAFHQTEVDSFTANGVTLTSQPYPSNTEIDLDASGNVISDEVSGVVEHIALPDGTVFVTAGRSNAITSAGQFAIQPQMGSQGNLAAFCAAFS
jgi:hypothetical protein